MGLKVLTVLPELQLVGRGWRHNTEAALMIGVQGGIIVGQIGMIVLQAQDYDPCAIPRWWHYASK